MDDLAIAKCVMMSPPSVDRQPIKAICRALGVSRKVVRKVIRSEATEFRYERVGSRFRR